MKTFYALIIVISIVPMLMILPALWNKRKINTVDRESKNAEIAQQRITELEKGMSEESENDLHQAKLELQATLLEDIKKPISQPAQFISKSWGMVIVLSVPLFSLGAYSYLGSPQFIDGAPVAEVKNTNASHVAIAQAQDQDLDIGELLATLESKLVEDPGNVQGWLLVARSHMSLGNYGKAETAFEKLNSLVPGNPDFLTGWADATIMKTGNDYAPQAQERIEQALAINSNHVSALWISSLGAESQGDHTKALALLNRLLPLVSEDPATTNQINQMIQRNRMHLEGAPGDELAEASTAQPALVAEEVDVKKISVNVSLDSNAIQGVSENYALFIFAKAVNGPPFPLAVSKHQVRDLPISIDLTENMSMMPNMTIATFDEVLVQARISKSGNPIQQPGDWISNKAIINQDILNPSVDLIIDRAAE